MACYRDIFTFLPFIVFMCNLQLGKSTFYALFCLYLSFRERPLHTRPNCHVIYVIALDTLQQQMALFVNSMKN
jgi:hypothetical protein